MSTVTEAGRYLTFTLNSEAYALDIFHVTEILEYRALTVVPMMPDFIRGVINLRGRAVPVIDLAIRFGRGSTTIQRRTSIIIVHITDSSLAEMTELDGADGLADGQDIGVLVDSASKVVTLLPDQIEPAPAFGAGIRADYISGMARRDDDFLILLDISHVLSISDMVRISEVAQRPAGHREPADPGSP
ncbi:chemotaxis protein CheW [Actinoplanes awajinensis]|uniref:chemotaxis protein CheW n=1 Tax=Actinoplanes awajinensis TaxID=135946 RepID=UPI000A425EB2|nr:chemotaxis protein CheW [Actinoplanes awajinensis]